MLPLPFSRGRRLGIALLLNLLTHPFLWYGFPRFGPYPLWLAVAEGWVALTEGLVLAAFWRCGLPRALGAAAAINLVSTLVGLALQR